MKSAETAVSDDRHRKLLAAIVLRAQISQSATSIADTARCHTVAQIGGSVLVGDIER